MCVFEVLNERAFVVWVQQRATCSVVTRAVVIEALGQTADALKAGQGSAMEALGETVDASKAGEWSMPFDAESFARPIWNS